MVALGIVRGLGRVWTRAVVELWEHAVTRRGPIQLLAVCLRRCHYGTVGPEVASIAKGKAPNIGPDSAVYFRTDESWMVTHLRFLQLLQPALTSAKVRFAAISSEAPLRPRRVLLSGFNFIVSTGTLVCVGLFDRRGSQGKRSLVVVCRLCHDFVTTVCNRMPWMVSPSSRTWACRTFPS
jgi:hypothetical protein